MAADAAWRVTGFMLRVSSWFYLSSVENKNCVLETALVSLCSTRENDEGRGPTLTNVVVLKLHLVD